jgi:hypothetical protein
MYVYVYVYVYVYMSKSCQRVFLVSDIVASVTGSSVFVSPRGTRNRVCSCCYGCFAPSPSQSYFVAALFLIADLDHQTIF